MAWRRVVEWRPEKNLTAGWLEERIPDLPGPAPQQPELSDASLVLRLSRWRHTQLLGESRLLASLWAAHTHGIEIRAELGRDLPLDSPPVEDAAHDDRWHLMRDELAGIVVGTYADVIIDGAGRNRTRQLRDQQRARLSSCGGLLSGSLTAALPVIDTAGAPQPAEIFQARPRSTLLQRRETIATQLRDIVFGTREKPAPLGLPSASKRGLRPDLQGHLGDWVHEAIENTRDHALVDLDGHPIRGMRFLLLRRINATPGRLDRLADVAPSSWFAAFLRGYAEQASGSAPLLEVSVADCGPGICGRLRRVSDVYRGSAGAEEEALQEAMLNGVTSKPAGDAGNGMGFTNMLLATQELRGAFCIRSGRFELVYDALTSSRWEAFERPYVAGTSVSLLWPWRLVRP